MQEEPKKVIMKKHTKLHKIPINGKLIVAKFLSNKNSQQRPSNNPSPQSQYTIQPRVNKKRNSCYWQKHTRDTRHEVKG